MSGKIGFIGGGSMAEGIIRGLLAAGTWKAEEILLKEILPQRKEYLKEQYQIELIDDLRELAAKADILVLAVRPQNAQSVSEELSAVIQEKTLLVSICAGIQIGKLSGWIGSRIHFARIMPNTLIETGKGYSALAFSANVTEKEQLEAQKITNAIGETLIISEQHFDAFTALGCAGPEWVLLFAAALIDAGVESGLSREDAKKIVVQNLIGTGLLLESTPKHIYEITDGMNTPGGIGIAGFHSFAQAGLHGIVMDAVASAHRRTTELGE
ncbi:MAG: pyrroline-5-carboxylate reductase [Lachnospiraceae bacterium]|nr:pyrroline-5-carboxylate reductase [Lachnospiraceae bacterium]